MAGDCADTSVHTEDHMPCGALRAEPETQTQFQLASGPTSALFTVQFQLESEPTWELFTVQFQLEFAVFVMI